MIGAVEGGTMKRSLAILAVALTFAAVGTTPAQANIIRGQHCATYRGDATHAEQVCVQVIQGTGSADGDYWIQATGTPADTYGMVLGGDDALRFWSSRGDTICSGNYATGCNGGGNLANPDVHTFAFTIHTVHLQPNEHLCSVWGQIVGTLFYAGLTGPPVNLNSYAFNTVPDCVV